MEQLGLHGLGEDGLAVLLEKLQATPGAQGQRGVQLCRLDWSHSRIGKQGALAVAQSLKSNRLMAAELVLDGFLIAGEGVAALLEALESNRRVKVLDLCDWRVVLTPAIISSLARLGGLHTLKLCFAAKEESLRPALRHALFAHKSLTSAISVVVPLPWSLSGADRWLWFDEGPARNRSVGILRQDSTSLGPVPALLPKVGASGPALFSACSNRARTRCSPESPVRTNGVLRRSSGDLCLASLHTFTCKVYLLVVDVHSLEPPEHPPFWYSRL